MGYTHYWTQKRNFTVAEWTDVTRDIGAILRYAQHDGGVPLANGNGDGGTSPEITADKIWFNGVGDDAHETMEIKRKRALESWQSRDRLGWSFCKTARKPYDSVAVACLCYLSTITRRDDPATGEPIAGTEAFAVTSDGDGSDFVNGLELARRALPAKANQLDMPMDIMRADRWCAPWISCTAPRFEVHFCVDGRGYVLCGADSYCFESHVALAQFLERTKVAVFSRPAIVKFGTHSYNEGKVEKNIWNAMGNFDKARHARIAKVQSSVLGRLFPVDPTCASPPPAYVRPGEMPDNAGRAFCYSLGDLLALGD